MNDQPANIESNHLAPDAPTPTGDHAMSHLQQAHDIMAARLAAITAAYDMVVITNAHGIIEYVNPAFTQCTGYTYHEAVGRKANVLRSGQHDDAFYDDLWNTILSGNVWQGRMTNRRKDGSVYPEDMTITPLHDDAGNIHRFVAIKRDVTDRLRVEQAEAQRLSLQNTLESMDRMLGIVGHELRTPLAAVRAASEFLLTECGSVDDQIIALITLVHDESVRMGELVNNLLEVARLNSGCTKWRWSHFQLIRACDEAFNVIRPLINHAKVNLQVQVDPDDLTMHGDIDAVTRLLINIVSNSAKHTTEGHIRVSIRAVTDAEHPYIEFGIDDTGEGIPEEVAAKMGQAFVLNSGLIGSDYAKGSGLGLTICRGIVAAHGGSIAVSSQPGRGSTFTVRLRADLTGPVEGSVDIARKDAA